MPSILSEQDRETVKRNIPKPGNKILAVAVARLYVAYPNPNRWAYTGLQGAVALANDLVGNTFWLKLVDISQLHKGVLWDQELYEGFNYNHDRTFFHTFELEDCLAGLSFVDEKEAKTFRKKVEEREKNAAKATRATPFLGQGEVHGVVPEKHSRFANLLHRHRSHYQSPQAMQTIIPPRAQTPPTKSKIAMLDEVDPSWRNLLGDLLAMGITESQIEENADFIKSYILDQQKKEILSNTDVAQPKLPPHPTTITRSVESLTPQTDYSSRRSGPPPPPPPAPRRAKAPAASSPPRSPPATPPPSQPRFKAPPPIADAGKFAYSDAPILPVRPSPTSNMAVPAPPPRPPKTPLEDDDRAKLKFAVPPPFQASRATPLPPVPPSRGSVPPPPPRSRQSSTAVSHATPSVGAVPPPPLPPKTLHNTSSNESPIPPPLPPPAPLPQRPAPSSIISPPATVTMPPPPPPPPPSSLLFTPAMSAATAPFPPPLPPTNGRIDNSVMGSTPDGDHGSLFASIRAAGGTGGAGLKKVKESEKRDRSAALVPGSAAAAAAATGAPANAISSGDEGGGGGGLATALEKALNKRKQKVSTSDDEDDNDDWD